MSGRRGRETKPEWVAERKSRAWEKESDPMKPPDVDTLEAAACATLKATIHIAQTVICDDIMLQCQELLRGYKECQTAHS